MDRIHEHKYIDALEQNVYIKRRLEVTQIQANPTGDNLEERIYSQNYLNSDNIC